VPSHVLRLADDLIKGTFSGYVEGKDVVAMHEAMRRLAQEKPAPFILIDTEPVTGFNPNVSVPGVAFLRDMKTLGVKRAIAIAPMSGVRMMGSAVSLGASLSMRFVESNDAAIAMLAELRAKP
jgi:hypothetical protein